MGSHFWASKATLHTVIIIYCTCLIKLTKNNNPSSLINSHKVSGFSLPPTQRLVLTGRDVGMQSHPGPGEYQWRETSTEVGKWNDHHMMITHCVPSHILNAQTNCINVLANNYKSGFKLSVCRIHSSLFRPLIIFFPDLEREKKICHYVRFHHLCRIYSSMNGLDHQGRISNPGNHNSLSPVPVMLYISHRKKL